MSFETRTYYLAFDNTRFKTEEAAQAYEDTLVEKAAISENEEAWIKYEGALPKYEETLRFSAFRFRNKWGKLTFADVFNDIFIKNNSRSRELFADYYANVGGVARKGV